MRNRARAEGKGVADSKAFVCATPYHVYYFLPAAVSPLERDTPGTGRTGNNATDTCCTWHECPKGIAKAPSGGNKAGLPARTNE